MDTSAKCLQKIDGDKIRVKHMREHLLFLEARAYIFDDSPSIIKVLTRDF
jgi:hypothetical protein